MGLHLMRYQYNGQSEGIRTATDTKYLQFLILREASNEAHDNEAQRRALPKQLPVHLFTHILYLNMVAAHLGCSI